MWLYICPVPEQLIGDIRSETLWSLSSAQYQDNKSIKKCFEVRACAYWLYWDKKLQSLTLVCNNISSFQTLKIVQSSVFAHKLVWNGDRQIWLAYFSRRPLASSKILWTVPCQARSFWDHLWVNVNKIKKNQLFKHLSGEHFSRADQGNPLGGFRRGISTGDKALNTPMWYKALNTPMWGHAALPTLKKHTSIIAECL